MGRSLETSSMGNVKDNKNQGKWFEAKDEAQTSEEVAPPMTNFT